MMNCLRKRDFIIIFIIVSLRKKVTIHTGCVGETVGGCEMLHRIINNNAGTLSLYVARSST